MSTTITLPPSPPETFLTPEINSGETVLFKLQNHYLYDLRALRQECLWLISNFGLTTKSDLSGNDARLLKFVDVIEELVVKIRALHHVSWDAALEQPLLNLEAKIINFILPVRARLHDQWKNKATSPRSSSSLDSDSSTDLFCLPSSGKARTTHKPVPFKGPGPALLLTSISSSALSRSLLRAGVPTAEKLGVNRNNFPLLNIVDGVVVEPRVIVKKEGSGSSSNGSERGRDENVVVNITVDCTNPNPTKRPKSTHSKGSTNSTNTHHYSHTTTSRRDAPNLSHVFDEPNGGVYDCIYDFAFSSRDLLGVTTDRNTPEDWQLQETLSAVFDDNDLNTAANSGVSPNVINDAGMKASSVCTLCDYSATNSTQCINGKNDGTAICGTKRSCGSIGVISDTSDVTPPLSTSSSSSALNATHNTNTINSTCTVPNTTNTLCAPDATFNTATNTLLFNTITAAEAKFADYQRRLRLVVPSPRLPRTADYTCSVCSTPYTITVHDNPWFAVYHHTCGKCKVVMVPRIDISTYNNSVELDPNNAALYGDGVDDGEVSNSILISSIDGSCGNGGSVGVVDFAPDELQARQEASKLLTLLRHVRTCSGVHSTPHHASVCACAVDLLLHVQGCSGCSDGSGSDVTGVQTVNGNARTSKSTVVCTYPWCVVCKRLLSHLDLCTDPKTCDICK